MEIILILIILVGTVGLIYENKGNKKNKMVQKHKTEDGEIIKLKRRKPREIVKLEKPNIEITYEIREILNKFENTTDNIFLTGKAGTGKSTLLKYFRATTNKKHAVVAPTGIAAINVTGQTIHSFFGFGIKINLDRVKYASGERLDIIRNIDTLIIDEISMVRADLLDCIDLSLRKNRRSKEPFGGVQILAIGDPYQLPPVVTAPEKKFFQIVYKSPHFFNAKSYIRGNFYKFELTKIFRQADPYFIKILNSTRTGEINEKEIEAFNANVTTKLPNKDAIKLVTTNKLAKGINDKELEKLEKSEKIYKGHIIGDFKEKVIPTDLELKLKEGARVMLLNNEKNGRWVNGDIGTIIELRINSVRVKFDDNTFDDIELNEWDNVKFVFDEEEQKIVPEIVGKFIQLPIKLAWAVTIHKSQGMSYHNVHIDFGKGTFAPGQAYVALSRCRSLSGLTLANNLFKEDILVDDNVKAFMGNPEVKNTERYNHAGTQIKTISIINKGPPTKSAINKLKFFVEYPEKYATGTEKAKLKVKNAMFTFEQIKEKIDNEFAENYFDALETYEKEMRAKNLN